ncbi:MAG: hypothetical protein PHI20_04920, partial [Endomicrobiaceae bacterium]|nr:hypothetical protein [Endomicrobiaceae bacterium]
KFDKIKNMEWNKDTEIVLLFMDILTCPYFDNYKATKITDVYEFKLSIMNLLNINSNQINLIKAQKYWFTKWDNFDFNMELEAKKSQEVY